MLAVLSRHKPRYPMLPDHTCYLSKNGDQVQIQTG